MASDDPAGEPLGNMEMLVDQVGRAVKEIVSFNGDPRVSLIGHAASTFVAGQYAELHPERVTRLVRSARPLGGVSSVSQKFPCAVPSDERS